MFPSVCQLAGHINGETFGNNVNFTSCIFSHQLSECVMCARQDDNVSHALTHVSLMVSLSGRVNTLISQMEKLKVKDAECVV